MSAFLKRILRPIVDVQESEAVSLVLMFIYSFLVMTAYNMLKPLTRSQFIKSLGADNLPYVLLAAGVLIGFIMALYSKLVGLLPRKWVIPIVQVGIAGLLAGFWLLFQTGAEWVSVGFYFLGLIMAVLLISQFWTLANEIYDPRQAKRVFGFIGGGSSLGGAMGSYLLITLVDVVGQTNLLLVSASLLVACALIVVSIMGREKDIELANVTITGEETEVGWTEAFTLLKNTKHLQIISMVIGFAAIGAAIIEQQLNMAAAEFAQGGTDLEKILGSVQLYLSIIGFVIQVWLTSRIHKFLGIGFALMILPVSLGTTGLVMLFNAVMWAPMMARIADTSLRYTVDKTTREILFLPLPTEVKSKAKPFVDVTMDRLSKGIGALLILLLIKPWGLNLTWQQLSFASLTLTTLWIVAAMAAKRGYLRALRPSIERGDVSAESLRLNVAELQTVETLISGLADPDEKQVIRVLEILEALDKRNLITPLLLYHESPRVRARALAALGGASPQVAERWLPSVQRMLGDPDTDVRAAAVGALASMRSASVTELVRPFLEHESPRLSATAAVVLARSGAAADVEAAEATLARLGADAANPDGRREVAVAVRQINQPRFHPLLVPLLYDTDTTVAEEAMRSVRELEVDDYSFVPTLVALLRHRRLKRHAREVLVSYGDAVVPALDHFLNEPDEDIWVRRHIPVTLARIGTQAAMDTLVRSLGTAGDGFIRFKLVEAIDTLHRAQPSLTFDAKAVPPMVEREARKYFSWLSLRDNLFTRAGLPASALLARALDDKMARSRDRIWRLLALLHAPAEIDATRAAVESTVVRTRSSALEYLDNILQGGVRKTVMPLLDDMPLEERVRKGNVIIRSRPRDVEETLLQLINDEDQTVAASAILLAAEQKVWGLAGDIEHVLAHRDAHDWYVFEAASWALAAQRMPEERRRSLWLEPLPVVEVASRLQHSPFFATTSVDELFRLAGTGRQVRYDAGETLLTQGQAADAMQFLLDGTVSASTGDGETVLAPCAALGFEEVVQNLPARATLRTTSRAVCLALSVEDCRTLLSENAALVEGLFRTILDAPAFAGGAALVRGTGDAEALASDGLSTVEKVMALQQTSTFASFRTDDLVALADAARTVPLTPGSALIVEGAPPALYILVAGEVAIDRPGAPRVLADPGDCIGLYETLAGRSIAGTAAVVKAGVALGIDLDALHDVLADRPSLLQQLFAALFGARQGLGAAA
jgi:ATP/ADP translocase/CRP-like cAMP-binding protein/HEAT repeat protein